MMSNRAIALFGFLFLFIVSYGQNCTVDPNATGLLYPAATSGLREVKVNEAFTRTLTISVPTDSLFQIPGVPTPVNAQLDSMSLINITGLPAGVLYTCEPQNCSWQGGSQGCISIEGTATQVGVYPVVAEVSIFATIPILGQQTLTQNIDSYVLYVVDEISNVETAQQLTASIYTTDQRMHLPSELTFTKAQIFNVLGTLVKQVNPVGQSQIALDDLPKGYYILKIDSKENGIITKPFVKP